MNNQYPSTDQDKITSHTPAFEALDLQYQADLALIEEFSDEDCWQAEYKTYLADRH